MPTRSCRNKNHLRNVKVTELKFNPDGTIQTIDPFVTEACSMFLGIDIGTSGVKAVVIDDRTAASSARAPPRSPCSARTPLWSEQDPDDWWAATDRRGPARSTRRCAASVRGIGLAGQMHGATLLDADDRPLRPAILWNDGRSLRRMRGAGGARCPTLRDDRRQHRDARLHRAQAALGARARAGDLRADRAPCCCPRTMSAC